MHKNARNIKTFPDSDSPTFCAKFTNVKYIQEAIGFILKQHFKNYILNLTFKNVTLHRDPIPFWIKQSNRFCHFNIKIELANQGSFLLYQDKQVDLKHQE